MGTSTLGKDFITFKFPALLEPVSPHYFQGENQLLAEGKQRVKTSGLRLNRQALCFWDRRVLRQNAASYALISSGRKWDANWSAPVNPRDLHSPALIRESLGSNFFGGRILLLITFKQQQQGYCSKPPSLLQSWLPSWLWSKQNSWIAWMSAVQLLSSSGIPDPFQCILFPPHPPCPGNLLITNSQLHIPLYE